MAKPRFHTLKIREVRPQTDLATALRFEIPDALRQEYAFVPGQYLTLRTTIDGKELRRSYSICSARSEKHLEIGVKRVPGGVFSNHAVELKAGDELQVMTPQGRFTTPIGGSHSYLLLAAGSGITPCLSIAKSVLEEEAGSTITLVYGNQSSRTIMFLNDINALKDRFTDRFQVIHALSREDTELPLFSGRLDANLVERLIERSIIQIDDFDAAYVCGPQQLTEELRQCLSSHGMQSDAIKVELFGTMPGHRDAAPAVTVAAAAAGDSQRGAEVAIILDGTRRTLTVDGAQHTVLAAARQAGLDIPFSCAGGMCCTCRCKIVSGAASMDVNYSLQDWEIEAGFTLACQSRPTSEHLVLDFDAS